MPRQGPRAAAVQRARRHPPGAGVGPSWVEMGGTCPQLGVTDSWSFQQGKSLGEPAGLAWQRDQDGWSGRAWKGLWLGEMTGSYLALGCVGHSPNRGDHGEGAGRLVGVLLPRDRVIGE